MAGQPPDTRAYNGFYYGVAVLPDGYAHWVVYDQNGQLAQNGAIANKDVAAAESAARDWIDYIVAVDRDGNLIPDDEEVFQNESGSFYGDYSGSDCKSQSLSWQQDFISIRSDGYFLQDNIKGDILNLDANDEILMTLPQGYKMKVNIVFKSQDAYGIGKRGIVRDNATLYLEGGDTLNVAIMNDEVSASFIQNGVEKIDPDNLSDYNADGVRKSVTLRMVLFEICTVRKSEEDEDDTDNGDDADDFVFDKDLLFMILGGLVIIIIAGYVINTTSEVDV